MQNSSFFIIKPIIIKIRDKKGFKLISTKDTAKRKQKKELLLIEKKYQRILLERLIIFRLLLKIKQETKLLMTIVSLLKQENMNHVNNVRDVFVKNILRKKVKHLELINNSINL